jgi:uncharacterized membrane protein YgdD (TMEM256/DUF423 family)
VVNETTRTSKQFIALGCFFGLGSVLVGAFGAHALEQRITISDIETIRLGAQYQMYHAFALILTSTFNMKKPKKIYGSHVGFFLSEQSFSAVAYIP